MAAWYDLRWRVPMSTIYWEFRCTTSWQSATSAKTHRYFLHGSLGRAEGRTAMSKTVTIVSALAVGLVVGVAGSSRLMNPPAEAQMAAAPASFSAVPGAIGA